MIDGLTLYHSLPYPLRVLAASARGYYLKQWRYGRETDRLIEQAMERETWSAGKWKQWQLDRAAFVLDRAARKVPYYKEYWTRRRRDGDRRSWEILEHWPVLSKDQLRAQPQAFVAEDCDRQSMYVDHTSGTTGSPLKIWLSRQTVRAWYALFELRWRLWNHVSRHDRWAILGGQLITPAAQVQPPYWVWNAGLNQLYMSSYHLAASAIPDYLRALRKLGATYLYGYASSLESLSRFTIEQGLAGFCEFPVAISNAEPLYPYQRELIHTAFGAETRDTYGMTEIVTAASECEAGKMHMWPEVGIVEVHDLETGVNTPLGEEGRLICTGLLNADMPLIRYDLGDTGSLSASGDVCSCGRALPIFKSIEGRNDDVILTPDGRRIGRLDPVFKTEYPIREVQVVQDGVNRLEVRYVPAPGFGNRHIESIGRQLHARVGDMIIEFTAVKSIPRGASGKFRSVICKLPRGADMLPGSSSSQNAAVARLP